MSERSEYIAHSVDLVWLRRYLMASFDALSKLSETVDSLRGSDAALDEPCPVCHAKVGRPCRNTINPGDPLPGREYHYARAEARA